MEYCIVSQSDVIRHPMFTELKNKENGLDAILFSMGMDITKGYEITNCEHRSDLTNLVVHCERYCGTYRDDEGWKEIARMIA